jgi:HlyD family secretion protein
VNNETRPWWRRAGVLAAVAIAAALAFAGWRYVLERNGALNGIASGNGRIEATEIDIAAKIPGRIKEILAREGDFVSAGAELARMDTAVLEAQRAEAQAQLERAHSGVATAESLVHQREAEKHAAEARVAQNEAERVAAQKHLARSRELSARLAISEQELDDQQARFAAAVAAVAAARAQVAAADAALVNSRAQVVDAGAAVDAARATIDRIQADIDDSVLRSPRDGRVQYRVAEPGEVLPAGGVVLNLVDLGDVYMTFFLPTAQAGRVALGDEVRLVLDAAPQYVVPARVSFVADVAQFTPKTVETAEERQKLMFRVKANIDLDLLKKHLKQVKTGLPGVAYVRIDRNAAWPEQLAIILPP